MMRAGNYGSSLVAYSIYKILESLGKSVLMINKQIWNCEKNKQALDFAYKHYPSITKIYKRKDDHRELNNLVDSFIVGSDTLWWWNDVKGIENFFGWILYIQTKEKYPFALHLPKIILTFHKKNTKNLSIYTVDLMRYLQGKQVA